MAQFEAEWEYQPQAPLGADSRWVRYRALRSDQTPVELCVFSESLVESPDWPALVKRSKLCAAVSHKAIRRVYEVAVDRQPPFVACEILAGETLAESEPSSKPSLLDIVLIGRHLAEGLAAVHRLGLAHGNLRPSAIRLRESTEWVIDMTRLAESARGQSRDEFNAPEQVAGVEPELAADVFGLGALLKWMLRRLEPAEVPQELRQLIAECMDSEPVDRPTAGQVSLRLAAMAESVAPADRRNVAFNETMEAPPLPFDGLSQTLVAPSGQTDARLRRLGRFELAEKLGEGGMGAVYRARDVADDATVAVKILNARMAGNLDSRRRFAKEARLLARVNNPFIANLLEYNDDGGVHFLAVEFVPGGTVAGLLKQRGRLDESAALALIGDAARGLAVAHVRGVVHRDIKPDNLLLTDAGRRCMSEGITVGTAEPLVKLSDFGLARAAQQTESLAITNDGTVLGTPYYMSPEQCRGETVDARSDIYSLGATLFHLIIGRPPFDGDSHVAVLNKHCHEPAPSIQQLRPDVSEGTANVVEKCLAKQAESRYPDAGELLKDVERLLMGEPTSMLVHPKVPPTDGSEVLSFTFSCELESSPAQLWPYVSNTDRVNHALGLPSVQYTTRVDPVQGVLRFAEAKIAGQKIRWQEHPYEWIEGRRLSVLREFTSGPFEWFINILELRPRGAGGTRLTQTLKVAPRNWLGRLLGNWELGRKSPRAMTRVYQGVDKYLASSRSQDPAFDAFGKRAVLTPARKNRLDQRLDRMREQRLEPNVLETLGQYLQHGSDIEVARIRPLVFAERFRLDRQQVIEACLHGAREGVLVLLWDILCPSCRIPADVQETLAALKDHGYCPACDLRYEIDFANSVEMIFRAHPEIRSVETRTYCIGGPAFSAHVVAQTCLAPDERFALDLGLEEGIYRLRGPQLPFALDIRVSSHGVVGRWELPLHRAPARNSLPVLRTGSQVITLVNDTPRDLQIRLERTAARPLAITAAEASAMALFREMFPSQVLSPGQIVSVTTVTLMQVQIHHAEGLYRKLGDGQAFGEIRNVLTQIEEIVRKSGGAVVKTIGDGVLATFVEPAQAVSASLQLLSRRSDSLPLQLAVHQGPALVTTLNDRLDYFGATVHQVRALSERCGPFELLLSDAIATQPEVVELMNGSQVVADILPPANGSPRMIVHRWRPAP